MAPWKLTCAVFAALTVAACAASEPHERTSDSGEAPAPSTGDGTSPVVTVELQAADSGAVWTHSLDAKSQDAHVEADASGSDAPQIIFKELKALADSALKRVESRVIEKLQELRDVSRDEAEEARGTESDGHSLNRGHESLVDDIEAQIRDALSGDWTTTDPDDGLLEPPELTDAFLELEKRVETEGFTPDVITQLQALASGAHGDAYAQETLAYVELFESATGSPPNVTDAVANLEHAAAAGVVSARSTLALLDLIRIHGTRRARHHDADSDDAAITVLEQLATQSEDLAASLATGYAHVRAMMDDPLSNDRASDSLACSKAVLHLHRSAESNVHWLADHGGEKPELPVVPRLSEQWRPVSTLFGADDHDALADPAQRFEYLRAVAGDPTDPQFADAAELVAQTYFYGDAAAGVAPDQGRAATYFQRAADAGDAHAQANYAMLLAHGAGVPQNNASARQYLELAAAQDNAFAHFGLGTLFQTGAGTAAPQNHTRALLHFEQAAALGYHEAHTYIGSAYLHGRGVAASGAKAYEHFALAAAAEHPSSQALFNLAVVQFQGVGTPKDCARAVHNFRAVALHPEALADLPFSLAKGFECVEKGDIVRAFLHYRLVAELGDEDAMVNAAYLLETYGEAVIATAERSEAPLAEVFKLYTRAASLNDTEALRRTAACSYDTWGGVCERNRSTALTRYALAAELGDAEAAFDCGLMYALGDGVPQDVATAKVRRERERATMV